MMTAESSSEAAFKHDCELLSLAFAPLQAALLEPYLILPSHVLNS